MESKMLNKLTGVVSLPLHRLGTHTQATMVDTAVAAAVVMLSADNAQATVVNERKEAGRAVSAYFFVIAKGGDEGRVPSQAELQAQLEEFAEAVDAAAAARSVKLSADPKKPWRTSSSVATYMSNTRKVLAAYYGYSGSLPDKHPVAPGAKFEVPADPGVISEPSLEMAYKRYSKAKQTAIDLTEATAVTAVNQAAATHRAVRAEETAEREHQARLQSDPVAVVQEYERSIRKALESAERDGLLNEVLQFVQELLEVKKAADDAAVIAELAALKQAEAEQEPLKAAA
jgi:chemotaxis protein histidine kinase CheA